MSFLRIMISVCLEDALRKLPMGSVAHVEEERKELVKDAHSIARLEVRLMSI